MAKRKKSYNLILYELQQEAMRQEALTGKKVTSNMALQKQAEEEYIAPIKNVNPANRTSSKNAVKITNKDQKELKKVSTGKIADIIIGAKKVGDFFEKQVIEPIGDFGQNYKFGKLTEDLGMESYKKMMGKDNKYDELKREYDEFLTKNPELTNDAQLLDQTIQTLPNQVGALWSGIKGGGVGGAIGATAGAIIGGAGAALGTAGTGTAAGATAGATAGAKWLGGAGYVAGSADYTYKLEAGLQYQTLIEMGVPEDIAKEESKDTGAINALIEGGESILDLVTLGGVSAIKGTLTKGLVKKYGEKTVAKWVGENVVKNAISEGIEEAAQESVSIHNEKQAMEQAGLARDDSQDVERIVQSGISGGFAGGIIGGGTAVVTGTTKVGINTIQNKNQNEAQIQGLQQEIAKETEELNKVQDPREKQIRQEKISILNEELTEIANAQQITKQQENETQVKLTEEEQYAINNWKNADSYIINESLREGKELTPELRKTADNVSSVLKKLPTVEGKVYRSITLEEETLKEFLNKYKQGEIIKEKAFTSASVDEVYDDTMNIQMEINSHTAKDTSNLMRADENEVIFDRNSMFKVIEVDSTEINNIKLTLEDVTNSISLQENRELKNETKESTQGVKEGYTRLYRGLENEYDPNYDKSKLDNVNGYESWTDNYELAKEYGKNVYYTDVPTSEIKNSVIDEDNTSETYGERNLIYANGKSAGINGKSGTEYVVYTDHDNYGSVKYNKVNEQQGFNQTSDKQATNKRQTSKAENIDIAPTRQEIDNLLDIQKNKSGSEYASAFFAMRDKYGQAKLYKALNEAYSRQKAGNNEVVEQVEETIAPIQETMEQLDNKLDALQKQLTEMQDNLAPTEQDIQEATKELSDKDLPPIPEDTTPEFEDTEPGKVESPLEDRDIDEVGNRSIKAYQYENPEVKPYFREEAQNMLYDLDNTIKGERGAAIDELGNMEYYGITRQTTEAIAYLKDNYGYSYDQIRQGLNKIIEDDGKENNAVSKRIEFMLDERLREGYTTSDGIPIPANQDYVNFLSEKQITEYNKEAFNAITDEDIPMYEKIEPRKQAVTGENTQVKQTTPMKLKTAQNGNTDVIKAKQRSWAETSTESDVIKGKILLSDLDAEKIQYVPITNKETLAKANAKFNSLGYDKALDQFYSKIKSGEIPKLVDITMGQRLMQEALAKGDKATATEILQDITILGTEVGQITQSLSIIQRMTPAGQLRMLEKVVQRGKLRGEKSFEGLELTEDMMNRIMDCYNEDGVTYDQDKLNEVMEQIKQELADQMPVTKMEKINEWRYFSMLGNPKTHARNIISTAANYATIEVKNVVARTMEEVAPVLGFDIDRTKTWKQSSQEVKDFAEKTTLEMKDIILGENQLGIKSELKAKRKIFKTEFWNKLFGGNSDLMTKEDSWFSKPTFKRSLQEFLTANGIETQQDIEANPKLVEKGKQYALEQAQIATFRQRSWLASKISEIERKNVGTQIAVGSVLPFKKTPINIAKAGLSYSPIGVLKSLTYDVYQVKKGNMEASTLIDHIAQGATGTALTLIGYMLTQAGFLNGAGDDDKEGKYDYYLGKQGYSINIGDSTYSLSWLSPLAMPLLVGANAYEKLIEKDEWNADVVLETLSQTLDPLSEMSFLSSLDDVMSSYDSGIMKWASIGQTAIQNYITQFVPTLSSQIAATMDDTKRTTKVSGDSTFKVGEELYNQLIYKIPVLRETLEPTLDIWGNEVKQSENLFTRAFENFISPYARKDSIATEIDEELKDLYRQTGDTGILPSIPSNYVNYDGEKYNMSAEEYTDYKKIYGQTANDLLEDLFRTTTYKNATSEERTDMVNDVYDYARDEAKLDYLAKEGVDYTNATEDKVEVYKENLIKGAIENDMTTDEYGLYVEDPEEYKFLMEKDYDYRQKYFDTYNSLKELDKTFEEQKEGTDDDDELDAIYSDKKAGIIDKIINSGLDATEKASLYKKYYNSDTVDTIMKSAISIDDYLVYETKEFKADKNAKGNSIPGSRKDKVEDYVFSIDGLNTAQKAIIIKATNTFKYNDYNEQIVRYVDGLGLSFEEVRNILEDLDMKVTDDGKVFWE